MKQVVKREVAAPEPVLAAAPEEAPITLKSSRRFWLITISVVVILAALIQAYGYFTGWGDPERLVQRYLNNGQRLTLAKRYDAAIKQYEKILKLKTSGENMRQALIAIADLYRERQEYSQAIEIYNQLRAQDPNSVLAAWAGLQVGDSQLLANQPDASYQTYLDISRKFPKSDWAAEAQLGTGKVLEEKEKYPEAIGLIKCWSRNIRAGSWLPRPWSASGNAVNSPATSSPPARLIRRFWTNFLPPPGTMPRPAWTIWMRPRKARECGCGATASKPANPWLARV